MPWIKAALSDAPKVYLLQADCSFSAPSKNVRYVNRAFCSPVVRINTVEVVGSVAMDKMSEQVKTLAVDMGVLPEEVVPALYQAISAGVPEKNVFGFLETATQLSIAGVTDLETAVDGLTTITNAYGVENISAQEAADTLFTAMKLGKTTVGEMAASLFQVVPAAAAAGITIEEVSAGLAAITAQGTPTRVAATQMRQAIVELGKAGTIAFKVFEEATGQTFPQFVRGGGTLEEAFQVLAAEAEASGGSISDMFGSVEAGMSALTLTSATGAAAWGSNMDAMADKTGAVSEGFDTMNEGIARGWDRISAIISVALIEIGESLAPVVEDFLEAFGEKIPGAAAQVGEAFTTIIGFAERVGAGFSIVKDAFDGVDGAARTAAGGIGLVSAAMLVLMAHPIIGFLGLVALALAEIGNNAKNAERLGDTFAANLDEIGDAAVALMTTLTDEEGIDEFAGIFEDIELSVQDMVDAMLAGGIVVDEFKDKLALASLQGDISSIEYKLVQLVLDDLGTEVRSVTGDLFVLAQQEEIAEKGARLLAQSGGAAADGIGLIGGAVDDLDLDPMVKEVKKIIGVFAEVTKQVDLTFDEIIARFDENITASADWTSFVASVIDAGMDDVAANLMSLPESQRAAFMRVIAESPGLLAEWEAALDPDFSLVGFQAAASIQAAWDRFDFRFDLPRPSVGAISSGNITNQLVGSVGGIQFGHSGGIVPGPRGAEKLMVLQGGEEITPLSQTGRGGGGVTIVQHIAGSILAEDEVLEIARQGLRDAKIDGGSLEF